MAINITGPCDDQAVLHHEMGLTLRRIAERLRQLAPDLQEWTEYDSRETWEKDRWTDEWETQYIGYSKQAAVALNQAASLLSKIERILRQVWN